MRKFLDVLGDHWWTILTAVLICGWVGHELHSCMRQDACESAGGAVMGRNRNDWRCVYPDPVPPPPPGPVPPLRAP